MRSPGNTRFRNSRGRVFRLALLIAVLTAVPASNAATEAPASTAANGVGTAIHWSECAPWEQDVQCARIRVPLDWDRPKGRTISLALVRHLASKQDEKIGTLFVNPGGPGDTGVGLVKGDPAGIDAIGDGRFDVVSWDPRGAHSSTRVRCFRNRRAEEKFWAGASLPTTASASKKFRRKTDSWARRCGRVSGWLLPHVSTADTVRDLDHLRDLMGEEKLTYIGFSYGTYIGQTYANMFPQRVRAMLLDGLIEPREYSRSAESRMSMFVRSVDEVYGKFLSLCDQAGPDRCALAGGELTARQRFNRLVARVKRKPLPAPGVSPPLSSPQSLNYGDLLLSQFSPVRSPVTWPGNAQDLAAAVRGDGSALESSAAPALTAAGWAALLPSVAIQCADGAARRKSRAWPKVIGKLRRQSPLQGVLQGWWEWAPCASWRKRGQDTYRGPWNARTPNPILLVNSTFDPNTAYVNAVKAERLLGNAVLLTHEGYGHLAFQDPSECVDEAEAAYLTELKVPARGTVCQSDRTPFDPDFGSPLP